MTRDAAPSSARSGLPPAPGRLSATVSRGAQAPAPAGPAMATSVWTHLSARGARIARRAAMPLAWIATLAVCAGTAFAVRDVVFPETGTSGQPSLWQARTPDEQPTVPGIRSTTVADRDRSDSTSATTTTAASPSTSSSITAASVAGAPAGNSAHHTGSGSGSDHSTSTSSPAVTTTTEDDHGHTSTTDAADTSTTADDTAGTTTTQAGTGDTIAGQSGRRGSDPGGGGGSDDDVP